MLSPNETVKWIVIWLQRETRKLVCSIVEALYPDEAIKKVYDHHCEDEEGKPTGTVFIGRYFEQRANDGTGTYLTPWITRETRLIQARPIMFFNEDYLWPEEIEARETMEALDNMSYESELWDDPMVNPVDLNWGLQENRDKEADELYSIYFSEEVEKIADNGYWGPDDFILDDEDDWLDDLTEEELERLFKVGGTD